MRNGKKDFEKEAILVLGYFFIQVAANLTVAKLIFFGDALAIPFGSLIYAVSFTWIDLINYRFGPKRARFIVFSTVGFNVLLVLWLNLYIQAPSDESWDSTAFNQQAIAFVFGGTARVFISSWVTNLVSENLDILVFAVFRRLPLSEARSVAARSAISNAFSTVSDAFLFPVLAFGGVLPVTTIMQIGWSGALFKFLIGMLSVPLVILVRPYFAPNTELNG